MSDTYTDFLRAKIKMASFAGFPVQATDVHTTLFPHQRDIVQWAVQGGNRAIFASLSNMRSPRPSTVSCASVFGPHSPLACISK